MSNKLTRLFPAATADTSAAFAAELSLWFKAMARVVPLKKKHAATLHYSVRDLSRALTSDRRSLDPGYMSRPESRSAYIRYFLPWNLIRLGRLFTGLQLDLQDGANLVDVGSGPLTVVQALWLSRPELRTRKLEWLCVDRSASVMKTGLSIFCELAGDSPWKIRIKQGGIGNLPHLKADMFFAANLLNELEGHKGAHSDRSPLSRLIRLFPGALQDNGACLFVEPGTRMAARTLINLRSELIDRALKPLAPCPHSVDCPMPGEANRPWCHFSFEPGEIPKPLFELSRKAGLPKERASLSFFYAKRCLTPEEQPKSCDKGSMDIRVVSDAFPVERGHGRYCCSEKGLVLLRGAVHALGASGDLVTAPAPCDEPQTEGADENQQAQPERDSKTGALIIDRRAKHPALTNKDEPRTPRTRAEKPTGQRKSNSEKTNERTEQKRRPRSDSRGTRRTPSRKRGK